VRRPHKRDGRPQLRRDGLDCELQVYRDTRKRHELQGKKERDKIKKNSKDGSLNFHPQREKIVAHLASKANKPLNKKKHKKAKKVTAEGRSVQPGKKVLLGGNRLII